MQTACEGLTETLQKSQASSGTAWRFIDRQEPTQPELGQRNKSELWKYCAWELRQHNKSELWKYHNEHEHLSIYSSTTLPGRATCTTSYRILCSDQIIKIAETAVQYQTFVTNNYSSFFSPNDQFIKELVQKAATEMHHITQKYDVPASRELEVVELALFDLVIVCGESWKFNLTNILPAILRFVLDNSSSMFKHRRALKDILLRLVTISSLLVPKGITIQLLYPNAGGRDRFENITTSNQVEDMFQTVRFLSLQRLIGRSGLGEVVNKKIVHPMIIRKAKAGNLKRPVITVIISDGEVGVWALCWRFPFLNYMLTNIWIPPHVRTVKQLNRQSRNAKDRLICNPTVKEQQCSSFLE